MAQTKTDGDIARSRVGAFRRGGLYKTQREAASAALCKGLEYYSADELAARDCFLVHAVETADGSVGTMR